MYRLSYRMYRLGFALRRWAARRLTHAGFLALGGMCLAGATGVDLNQSMGSQAFAMGMCLFAVAMLSALFFRGRFEVARSLPRYASVGQPFRYRVQVHNRGPCGYRHLDLIEDVEEFQPEYLEFKARLQAASRGRSFSLIRWDSPKLEFRRAVVGRAEVSGMAGRGRGEAEVEVMPLRRGPLRFKGSMVARPDPLGLFRGMVRVPGVETVLVLPRRYGVPDLVLPGLSHYQRGGVALASSIGQSDEFVSLRDYQPGDPLRHIHWRSWARTGRPVVKEHQDEYFVRHALVLDTFAPAGRGEAFEEAVSVAASFACTVATQESLLDLLFVGPRAFCFTTGRGVGHQEQALGILAGVQRCEGPGFDTLRHLVLGHADAVCGCIGVFLDWDEPRRELVRQLRRRGMPVLALVVAEPQKARELAALMAEGGQEPCRILEVGRVAEGLRALEGAAA